MKEQSEIQIFLSYANLDQDRVLPVYEYLIKNGYPNAWIDCKKLLPGQPWEHEIMRNLRKSEMVLVFLSHNSVSKRGVVQKEMKVALSFLEEKLQSDIYIIPIKLDSDVVVPEALLSLQWLDLEKPNSLRLLKQALDRQAEDLGFDSSNFVNLTDEIHITKKVVSEKWEGLPGYEVEYSLPVLHSTEFTDIGEVTRLIDARYLSYLHLNRRLKIEQEPDVFSWAQFPFQRTNTFDAHYSSVYHRKSFISVAYTVTSYYAGAAHPNYHIETFNYLLNPLFELNDIKELFLNTEEFFPKLQKLVRTQILSAMFANDDIDVDDSSKEWVDQGTEDWSSFRAFTFSDEGLKLYFSPYQVGPFAMGTISTTVSYDFICRELKSDFRHALDIYYLCI